MFEAERTFTIIALVLIILAVSLHYAVAARGLIWYDSLGYYMRKKADQYGAYIITTATGYLVILTLLLVDMFKELFRFRNRFILIVSALVLAFSLAIVVSLLASVSSIQKEQLGSGYKKLDVFNGLAIADAVVTWLLEVVPLGLIFYFSLDKLASHGPQPANKVEQHN